MLKKILKIVSSLAVLFSLLLIISNFISEYRLHKYNNSVVNEEVFPYNQIDSIFEKTNSDTIYVFLYDEDSDDCVYLDEVLLKEISYEHNGITFENIYKVNYEQSYRSYIRQIIKNTFNIDSFPAIVAISKTEDSYEKVDSFEYVVNSEENLENLESFLERNQFFEISQKN